MGGRTTQVGRIDFTAPGAAAFHGSLLARPVANGHDGWMEDYGGYTPPDSVSADGSPGTEMHNRYPVLYHRSGQRFADAQSRPIARFVRSGYTGLAPYAPVVWGGDPTTGYGFDGLRSSVTQGLSMGLSGVSSWGSDVGGFFSLSPDERLTPELLARWIQLGAVSGVMRTKAEGIGVPKAHRSRPAGPAAALRAGGSAPAAPAAGRRHPRGLRRRRPGVDSLRDRRARRVALQASLATLEQPASRPTEVTLDGRPPPRRAWRYDPHGRVLRATFTARRGILRVR